MVSIDEIWLYHYDPKTKQQSMEWRHSGSPSPKKLRAQKSAGKFWPRISAIKTAFFSLITFRRARPKYQRGVLLTDAGAIEGHFEGIMPRLEVTKGVLFLHDNAPAHRALVTLNKTGLPGLPMSRLPTTFSGSGPVGPLTVPWTEKTIERWPFFDQHSGHCYRGDLVGRTIF
jgi:hypothetical protein